MRQTKIGLILAVTTLLAACGDSATPDKAASVQGTTQPAAVAKQDVLGDKRSLIHEYEPLPMAGLQLYKDSMSPFVLVDLYHTLTPGEEGDVDVADSMGYSLDYEGFPPDIIDLVARYKATTDAFEQRDIAKALSAAVQGRKLDPSDRRLRLDFTSQEIALGSYDFDRKGFPVGATLFRPEPSEMPSSWAPLTANPYAAQARTYISIPPGAYRLGFDKAEGLTFLKVEDEAVARVIESNLNSLRIAVYGSVVRVFRDYEFGVTPYKPKETRYVIIQPQRVELVDAGGKVVFTFDL